MDALLQRAHAVGEDLRQHRDHVPRQIGTVASRLRLAVERSAHRHERRDVGDVHAEAPARGAVAFEPLHADRVVEVASVGRIDGDGEQAGQILAIAPRSRGVPLEVRRHGAGLLEHGLGKGTGQPVAGDDRGGLDIELAGLAEDLDDHALAEHAVAGMVQQFEDDLVAALRVLRAGIADDDRIVQHPAVGDREPLRTVLLQRAAEARASAGDDLLDATVEVLGLVANGAATGTAAAAEDPRADAIAADRIADAFGGNEEVALAEGLIRDHEAEASRGDADAPFDLVGQARQAKLAVGPLLDRALAHELVDRLVEGALGFRRHAKLLGEHVRGRRRIAIVPQMVEDALPKSKRHGRSVRGARASDVPTRVVSTHLDVLADTRTPTPPHRFVRGGLATWCECIRRAARDRGRMQPRTP